MWEIRRLGAASAGVAGIAEGNHVDSSRAGKPAEFRLLLDAIGDESVNLRPEVLELLQRLARELSGEPPAHSAGTPANA